MSTAALHMAMLQLQLAAAARSDERIREIVRGEVAKLSTADRAELRRLLELALAEVVP